MAIDPVTPQPGLVDEVVAGGVAVDAVGVNPQGGFITNPSTASEPLYVDPVGTASLSAEGTTFALWPGQTWSIIPGQTTPTSVNAVSNNHKFSIVVLA